MFNGIKNIKSNKNDLFKFGIFFGTISFILGSYYYYKINDFYLIFYFISILFVICALKLPNFLKLPYLIWMIFSLLVGWFMTRLILIMIFYIILFPISLILRIFNKDLLKLNDKLSHSSYWNQRDDFIDDMQTYEKQY
jgi:hypothetical protein